MKNLILILLVGSGAIMGFNTVANDTEPVFVHSVYFWLKDNVTEEQRVDFLESLRDLKQIESVEDLEIGIAAGTPRDVVDNTYDVALLVYFKDKAGHDLYQDDPIHKASIAIFQNWIDEIKIYDAICE